MSNERTMKALVQNACFAADAVAIGFEGTGAEKTRAVIAKALEALEANGMIVVTPIEEWPTLFFPDPPSGLVAVGRVQSTDYDDEDPGWGVVLAKLRSTPEPLPSLFKPPRPEDDVD